MTTITATFIYSVTEEVEADSFEEVAENFKLQCPPGAEIVGSIINHAPEDTEEILSNLRGETDYLAKQLEIPFS